MTKSQKRGLVPTKEPEPDFSWKCSFHWVLDDVELIMYEISETLNDWMQRYGQKTSKMPPKWGFSPIFKNLTLSLLYNYGTLTACKRTNEWSLRYLKTDQQTDQQKDKGNY